MTSIDTKDDIKPAVFAEMAEKLDAAENIRSIDPAGMYDRVYRFPEPLEEAVEIGGRIKLPAKFGPGFENIIVAGMGG